MALAATHTPAAPQQHLRLWLRLYRTVGLIEREIRARLTREYDISLARFDLMSALERADGPLTMGQLSERLLVSNGNVTGLITRLVEDDWVTRTPLPNDRRSYHIETTEKGRECFAEIATAHAAWVDELLNAVPADIAEALSENLDHILHSPRFKSGDHRAP